MKYYELRRFAKFGLYKTFETKWKKDMSYAEHCNHMRPYYPSKSHLQNFIYNTAGKWPRYKVSRGCD